MTIALPKGFPFNVTPPVTSASGGASPVPHPTNAKQIATVMIQRAFVMADRILGERRHFAAGAAAHVAQDGWIRVFTDEVH